MCWSGHSGLQGTCTQGPSQSWTRTHYIIHIHIHVHIRKLADCPCKPKCIFLKKYTPDVWL